MATPDKPSWKELPLASHIDEPGNSARYRTGDWKTQIPETFQKLCIRCGLCYIFCPDMARIHDEKGYFDVDPFYCKGCGICAEECPTGAIKMREGK